MLDEGIDVADQRAVDAWIAELNELPLEERNAILGISLPAMLDHEDEEEDEDE